MTAVEEIESIPPAPPGRHPLRWVLLGVGALVFVLLVWVVTWYELQVHGGPPGVSVIVTVPEGSSLSSVDQSLSRAEVVSSSLALRVYYLFHTSPVVQPGQYSMHKSSSFAAVLDALDAGPNVVAIPAGFTVYETAQRLGQFPGRDPTAVSQLISGGAVSSPFEPSGAGNLDGLLGVGDYVVHPGEPSSTVLEQMVTRFQSEAQQVDLVGKAAALGITPYQAVIVASIVEKEGVYPQNVGKVARVIYNRLARGMPLQMDSTVLYSEHRDGGPVTSSDLALDTPYNTYLHAGLTPTPVSFPSLSALNAALDPTPGDWLYFVVVQRDGTEAFSDTYAGQLANEQLAKSRGLG